LVLNYALRRHPSLAGVIATSPWLRLAFMPPTLKLTVARAMGRLLPTFAQSNGLNPADLSHDPDVVRSYEIDAFVHDRITARMAVSTLDAGEWTLAHASEFALPLLIVHGSCDRITSAEASQEFARQVPCKCAFKLWEGLYHETHNELEKSRVLQFMIDWLMSTSNHYPR
jgi:alpha-beta hydrolase superfamily lysophospholipase